jgi:mRNA-degrading endonuclease RelE of RelBE toxin-antitoxin system
MTVLLSPSATRALDWLPHKAAAAISEFVTVTLPTDPYRLWKPLRFEFEGWRVARRGDYRVTFRALYHLDGDLGAPTPAPIDRPVHQPLGPTNSIPAPSSRDWYGFPLRR